jgi:hypothetical protein
MTLPSFLIDIRKKPEAALEHDVRNGGLFVPGAQQPLNQDCEVTFRFDDAEHSVAARVVFADQRGIGLELFVRPPERVALADKIKKSSAHEPSHGASGADEDCESETMPLPRARSSAHYQVAHPAGRGELPEFAAAAAAASAEVDPVDAHGRRVRSTARPYEPVHERVRNLSVAEQLRLAHHGEQQERVLLERVYGKTVWEALLRNPRITAPEVARIARMVNLPKPLLESISGNAAWLQVPEIRRALLGNSRLAAEMIPRVLRMLPRHELKLVPLQTAYATAVRDVARRMLREGS